MKPDIVLVEQFASSYVYNDKPTFNQVGLRDWAEGVRSTLAALSPIARQVTLIRDTPSMRFDVPTCVARAIWWESPVDDCSRPRSIALREDLAAVELDAVQSIPNATYLDLTAAICGAENCRGADHGNPIFRDSHHLSQTFAAAVAEAFASRLETGPARLVYSQN